MSFNDWKDVILSDIIQFNPRETIKKGELSKKIAMEKLDPYTRKISGYEEVGFTSGTKFRNGDTLFARITPCLENGKTAQVTILEENEVAFGSTEFIVMREKIGKTINDFIYYLSISDNFRNIAIKSMTGTSGRQRAQKDVIESSMTKLPPIEEQKAIAKILSDLDDKIEVNNKINKKLEDMAQAIFKQWFVDFDFPNEEGKPYKSSGGEMIESELGMIPKGWEVKYLKSFGEVITGKTPSTKKESNYGDKYPFITIPDMHNSMFINKTARCLSKEGNSAQPKKLIPKNSLVVSCIATVGLVSINSTESHTNQQINTIVPKSVELIPYLFFSLKDKSEYLNLLGSSGTTTKNVNKTAFENIKSLYPNENILKKYYETVQTTFKKIQKSMIEIEKLIELRDTLLPKLMSGEIRVSIGK